MKRALCLFGLTLLGLALTAQSAAAIDMFDRHTSGVLRQAIAGQQPLASMTSRDAATLQRLSAGISHPAVVVETAEGNLAKLLVSWAFRKGVDKPVPVLIIERFVTYDAQRENQALASGREIMLFPGFQFNLDIGQVVPADQGGDLVFEDKKLATLGDAKLYALDGPAQTLATTASGQQEYDPTDHEGVRPRDFGGQWQVNADGRWVGDLDLIVTDNGSVKGSYTSADSQSTYPVKGKLPAGSNNRIQFEVELPAAVQQFDGYLWTTDKATIAGTTNMVGQTFGFYAKREGTSLEAAAEKLLESDKPGDDKIPVDPPPPASNDASSDAPQPSDAADSQGDSEQTNDDKN